MRGALLCALLLASSGAALAQARFDCSKTKDPKACEERLAKARAAHAKARAACEGRQGEEMGDCMRVEMCAQSADPAKCEAHFKERLAQRSRVREACKDKTGDALKSCVREQRQKK